MPFSIATCAAFSAESCAAYGVLLRDPLKPTTPPEPQATTFPLGSVIVTIVLLNVEVTNARPRGMFFRSRRRVRVAACVCRVRPIRIRPYCLRVPYCFVVCLLRGLLLACYGATC